MDIVLREIALISQQFSQVALLADIFAFLKSLIQIFAIRPKIQFQFPFCIQSQTEAVVKKSHNDCFQRTQLFYEKQKTF